MVEGIRRSEEAEKGYTYTPLEAIQPTWDEDSLTETSGGEELYQEIDRFVRNLQQDKKSPNDIAIALASPNENIEFDSYAWLLETDHEAIRGADENLVRFGLWAVAEREAQRLHEQYRAVLTGIYSHIYQGEEPDIKYLENRIGRLGTLSNHLYEEEDEGFRIVISKRT